MADGHAPAHEQGEISRAIGVMDCWACSVFETGLPEDGNAEQEEIRVDSWVVLGEAGV
jgi:hypothetical protein